MPSFAMKVERLARLMHIAGLRGATPLRSLVVSHAMRYFSAWARHAPKSAPRIMPMQHDST